MDNTRRHILFAGAALIGGCQAATRTSMMPSVDWPSSGGHPTTGSGAYIPRSAPVAPPRAPRIAGAGTPISPLDRTAWASAAPSSSNINPMNGVGRITVHHEGSPQPVFFTDARTTASHLEHIRRAHRSRGWADIGYHFIVDRAGRVWEGRPLNYQGAHVSENNEHNIGVMALGNFNIQQPSDPQLASLHHTIRHLRRNFRISQGDIFTHQELRPTACPGRSLQPRIASMRNNGLFA